MTTTDILSSLQDEVSIQDIDRVLAEKSMHEYIIQAWPTLEPGRTYYDNWHIQSICEHLEAVVNGDIRRLIINIPPRHMKSITCSVAFLTWAWIHKPHLQFLYASYASSLSIRDSVKCRRLINSPWYQQNWSNRFQLSGDQNVKSRFENTHNGHRIASSVGGGITGEGGDIIVVDDPHNVNEAESDTVRTSVIEWWDSTLQTRLNDPRTGAFVVIMQRVHQSDLTGHILRRAEEDGTEWTHLCVPAEYEQNHPFPFHTTLPTATHQNDPRTEEDELLWPERIPLKILNSLKTTLGTYASAGQLQQRPAPKGGGIIKAAWWQKWPTDTYPPYIYVLQSWDTAFSEKDTASFSACTTWAVFARNGRYNVLLIDYYRDRVAYPDLRRKAQETYKTWQPDAVIIEKKASGQSLIQDLRQANVPVITYSPDRDKVARAHAASPLFESGIVWYPDRRWAQEVIDHCATFPAGDGADVMDTVTQALIRLHSMWFAVPLGDDTYDVEPVERDDPLSQNVVSIIPRGAVYG